MLASIYARLQGAYQARLQLTFTRNGTLRVGKHTYGCPRIQEYRGSERKVRIGSYCSIAPDVTIITGGVHPVDWVSTFPFRARWNMPGAYMDGMPSSNGDVIIGSDVWIGTHVIILSGVTIGHGAVIATGSVVTKDVPPYALVGGSPARIIRNRFSDDHIAALLHIRWWTFDESKLRPLIPLLSSNRVDEFIEMMTDQIHDSSLSENCH